MTLCLFLVLANDQGRLLTSVAVLPLFSTKQVRQPGDVRGDPSRFIVGHEIGCGTPSWLQQRARFNALQLAATP
jgi:hypothetical protein